MGSNTSKQITNEDKENRILLKLGEKWIDATDFIDQHPGGAKAILNKRNQDIVIDYNFHSKAARKMMNAMIINS